MKYKIEYIRIDYVDNTGAYSYSWFGKYADGINELKHKLKDISNTDDLIRFRKIYKIYKDFHHIDVTHKYIDWGGKLKCW